MSRTHCFAILLGVLEILSTVEVDAQSTVDDSASCESSTFDEAVNIIKEGFREVKNLLGSNLQSSGVVDTSSLCE